MYLTGVFMILHLMQAPTCRVIPTSIRRFCSYGRLRLLSPLTGLGPMNSDWQSSSVLFFGLFGSGGTGLQETWVGEIEDSAKFEGVVRPDEEELV